MEDYPPNQNLKPVELPTAKEKVLTTEEILAERGKTHGNFEHQATLTQSLEQVFYQLATRFNPEGIKKLSISGRESLHQIFTKLGRIGIGDPTVIDHWDDLSGYPKLEANILREKAKF